MRWEDEYAPQAAKVREGKCPKCNGALVKSTDQHGCWIPFHYRCPECRVCWRDDGTGRGCRVGGGYRNGRRIRHAPDSSRVE